MRKIFTLLCAAFMATTAAWADTNYMKLDSMPTPAFLTDITFDPLSYELCFKDTFAVNNQLKREYHITTYARDENTTFFRSTDITTTTIYSYGYFDDHRSSIIAQYSSPGHPYTMGFAHHNGLGGLKCTSWMTKQRPYDDTNHTFIYQDLKDVLDYCTSQGYYSIRLFICPTCTGISPLGDYLIDCSYYHPYTSLGSIEQYEYLANYIDIDLPFFSKNDLSAPSSINYGEQLQLSATIQAAGKCRYNIQQDKGDGNWTTIHSGALSAAEAKQGANISYKRVLLDKGVKNLQFRVCVSAFEGIHSDTSEIQTMQVYYPLSVEGNTSYKQEGESFSVTKASDCSEWAVSSDIPVTLAPNGNMLKGLMPACPVWLYQKEAKYTVTFVDYDYSVLKTQEVDCGEDATAPTTPSHANMTFDKWSDPFTNIHANTTVRALYTVSGVTAELSIDNNPTYVEQGQRVSFNMYVKASAAAQVTLQYAWLDNEGAELSWEESSTRTSYTAAEAGAGTSKVRSNVTVLPTGSNNYGHRARFFRLCVRLSGSTNNIYSNVLRLNTYYPVNIYSEKYSLYTQTDKFTLSGNGSIYSRPLDTIWVRDVESDACHLKFYFTNFSGAKTGSDENGDYFTMPAGSGEGGVTVKHEKFKVVFFVPGHGNHYWETIYGAGAYVEKEVECGQAVALPEPELGEGELLLGWAPRGTTPEDGFLNVTSDMQFDALIESINMHTVTFKDWNNTTLKTESVYDGENATPPAVGERDGYAFIGWDGSYTTVTEDRTLTAQYEEMPEGIDNTPSPLWGESERGLKLLRNGILYIERNGKVYTAQGAEVR